MTGGNTRKSREAYQPNGLVFQDFLQLGQSHVEEIDRQCGRMPPEALLFLLGRRHNLNLYGLARFWSSPTRCEYTRGEMAEDAAKASWYIAMQYLNIGKVAEAKALTLNGSFLRQCLKIPIETIAKMCGEDFSNSVKAWDLPILTRGFHAIQSPQVMKRFLKGSLPGLDWLISADEKMGYVGSISDNWKSSSAGSHQKPSGTPVGLQIQLVLVDDTNDGRCHSLDVGFSTALKVVFNDYAHKRGVSLRSLRFSYRGKTLFLSSVGNRTPGELNMRDQDVIKVSDVKALAKESNSGSSEQVKKKVKSKNSTGSKVRRRGKAPAPREQPAVTLEEFKNRHSKVLTIVHEELQPRLKEIRNRLNALGLERQPPKQKKKSKRKKKAKESVGSLLFPDSESRGAKAGKPYFIIQVGEVENLYKTKKPCHLEKPCASTTLDLHGYSKKQALDALNEKLPEWVDTAMSGEYPWVMAVHIICGCGGQVLSGAVQEWIKSTRNVSNAPKNCIR